jgi:hypothetical protein
MERRIYAILFCWLFLNAQSINAQAVKQGNTPVAQMRVMAKISIPSDSTKEHLWLYNSADQKIEDGDSLVPRSYFWTKWIAIQSELPFGPNAKYWLITQPIKGAATADSFTVSKLPEAVVYRLDKAEAHTRITVVAEETNEKIGERRAGSLSFILE